MNKEIKRNLKDFSLFVITCAIAIGIHYLVNPDDLAMSGVNPNPLVIISVIFSAYRGVRFAFACSIFSAILYFGLFLAQVDFKAVEDIYSVNFLMLPILIVMSSILVGEFQQKATEEVKFLKAKVDEKKAYFAKVRGKQDLLEKENYHLKKRIVTKLDTIKSLHRTAVKLNSLDVDELTNNLIDVVKSNIEVKTALFYTFDEESKIFEISAPSDIKESELKKYNPESDQVVLDSISKRSIITIRDIAEDESFDEPKKKALLCAPVFKDGEVYGVFVILEMSFLELVPQTINIIEELVLWFEESISIAMKYQISSTSSDSDFRYKAYKYKYFRQRLTEELALSEKYSIPLHVLKISLSNLEKASGYRGKMLKKFVVEYLRTKLNLLDSVCLGEAESELLVIFFASKDSVLKKVNEVNKGLERFNLVVEDKVPLEISYFLANKKPNSGQIVEVLENFEKVS